MKVKDLIPVTKQKRGHVSPIILYDDRKMADLTNTFSLENEACKPYHNCNVICIQSYSDGLVISIEN